jgi:hypothetical protein
VVRQPESSTLFSLIERPTFIEVGRSEEYNITIFAFLRAEGGKNIHFPARGSASEALAAFYQKICLNTVQLTMEFG